MLIVARKTIEDDVYISCFLVCCVYKNILLTHESVESISSNSPTQASVGAIRWTGTL